MTTLDKLRGAGCSDEEAKAIEQALMDSEAEIRHCPGECSDCCYICSTCRYIQTCMY